MRPTLVLFRKLEGDTERLTPRHDGPARQTCPSRTKKGLHFVQGHSTGCVKRNQGMSPFVIRRRTLRLFRDVVGSSFRAHQNSVCRQL